MSEISAQSGRRGAALTWAMVQGVVWSGHWCRQADTDRGWLACGPTRVSYTAARG